MTKRQEIELARSFSSKVEALAGYGLPAHSIALMLELNPEQLQRDYARELASGSVKANVRVAESLYRKATGEGRQAVTAAIFWLKTRAHWKETSVHEHAVQKDIRSLLSARSIATSEAGKEA